VDSATLAVARIWSIVAIIHGVLYLLVTSPTRLVTSPACADMANKWENVVTFTDAHVKQS